MINSWCVKEVQKEREKEKIIARRDDNLGGDN